MFLLAYDPAQVKPGLVAFLIVAALGAATYLLVRSMNKQLTKINFEEESSSQSGGQHVDDQPGERAFEQEPPAPEHGSARAVDGESPDRGGRRAPRD